MSAVAREDRFRFLYRQSEGAIDRATWLRASVLPVGVGVALTLVAFWIAPDKPRDLDVEAFVSLPVVARQAYLIVYAFVLLICLVAEYYLSAKRFRDRRKPAALAGVAPFALLIIGAANWYQPLSEGWMSYGELLAVDALSFAAIAWQAVELGFGAPRS
jgi:uncharacterized membrane protein YhaH (DUF805 family)